MDLDRDLFLQTVINPSVFSLLSMKRLMKRRLPTLTAILMTGLPLLYRQGRIPGQANIRSDMKPSKCFEDEKNQCQGLSITVMFCLGLWRSNGSRHVMRGWGAW